ncbi:hypothetical protein F2P81_011307 [Scophthalmus maximus]|uniref:Uncharacterized protein n=1 Tax=Scophthalmus maximus TaxID=52904 RepID=A0A6A4STJ4_SCOMX|nr:hypothetical protein F2P81_011307 [Scophthalmus maximus]
MEKREDYEEKVESRRGEKDMRGGKKSVILLLTILDFHSTRLLLIGIDIHRHLGSATFKLRPLKLVTAWLR